MGIAVLSIESLLLGCCVMCVVPVFLGSWLSSSSMYVLLFVRGAAVALILIVLLLVVPTTIQHSCCLLFYPCPPHRQLLFLSFTALCFGHLSSFPFLNFFPFTYSSPNFLHTLAYWKHTAYLFHMHWLTEKRNGCCVLRSYFLQYLHATTVSTEFFFFGLRTSLLKESLMLKPMLFLMLLLLRFLLRCFFFGHL